MRKLAIALLAGIVGCGSGGGDPGPAHWVATWATGPQLTEDNNKPPVPSGPSRPDPLTNATLRQVVHASIGGSRMRLRLSNEHGNGPVEILTVRIARPMGGTPSSAIDPNTSALVTFDGSSAVTIPAGEVVTSDELAFDIPPLGNVTISMAFGATPSGITGHPGSRTHSYVVAGDETATGILSGAVQTEHWYYIEAIDVDAPANTRAVAILGDSITDGRGTTTNGNDRWPDVLSARLQAESEDVAVVNLGIGGNAVVTGGLGPTALARFDSDILAQSGVAWVIVFEGVNDIGNAPAGTGADVAEDLIDAYRTFIADAHAAQLRVYGATITPLGGHTGSPSYDTAERRQARNTVNDWIRHGDTGASLFDAVIDLDAAVRAGDPDLLLAAYDSGDHLHLNPAGYAAIAEAVDLDLFVFPFP